MEKRELGQVREIILAFPEASEKKSYGGAICFSILGETTICYYHENYQGSGRVVLWCPAYSDLNKDLIRNKPQQYFQPLTSAGGHFSEWLWIYLDTKVANSVDWKTALKILEDAFLKTVPKELIAKWKKGRPVMSPKKRFSLQNSIRLHFEVKLHHYA